MKKIIFALCLFISIGTLSSCCSDDEEYIYIENYLDGGGINIFHAKDTLINIRKGEEVVIDMRHDAEFEIASVTDNYRECLNGQGTRLTPIDNQIDYLWVTLKRKSKTKFLIKTNKDFVMDGNPKDLFFIIQGGKTYFSGYLHISFKD